MTTRTRTSFAQLIKTRPDIFAMAFARGFWLDTPTGRHRK